MLAYLFHVSDQVCRGVVFQRRVRPRSSGATLVKQDNAVDFRIEELPVPWLATGAGTAVHEHCGYAVRVAAFLYIQLMDVVDLQVKVVVRQDFRKQGVSRTTLQAEMFPQAERGFGAIQRIKMQPGHPVVQ